MIVPSMRSDVHERRPSRQQAADQHRDAAASSTSEIAVATARPFAPVVSATVRSYDRPAEDHKADAQCHRETTPDARNAGIKEIGAMSGRRRARAARLPVIHVSMRFRT